MRKTTLRCIRHMINEELAAVPSGESGIGKVINDLTGIFQNRMKSQFPDQAADQLIQKETEQLRSQVLALIKASATRVKMGAKPS